MSDCHKKIEVDLKEKILCAAQSAATFVTNQNLVTLTIPANAGITKIYASITQTQAGPIDTGQVGITLGSNRIFLQQFSKDPETSTGQYETTLVQPLCVGPGEALVYLSTVQTAFMLTLTVVYCPDYCKD
ncbi:MAG: hypothetical protein AB6733_13895 [Clostridiaceae bacterium]